MRLTWVLSLGFICQFAGAAPDANSTVRSRLRLQQSQYLGAPVSESQQQSYADLSIQSEGRFSDRYWGMGWNFFGGGSLDDSGQSYLAMPEFFASYRSGTNSEFFLGRRKSNWSLFDEEWHLGIWQSQVRWDYIHPTSQGLIGLFWNMKGRDWQLELLASPMFMPDQGPQFTTQDGRIRSANRWFWEPQINATISSMERPIFYEVMRPPESEVLFRGGFASRIHLGQMDEGPWAQMAYAYKPLNQLHLGIEPLWRPTQIDARIYPSVVQHHVVSLEGGSRNMLGEAWVSFTGDFPDQSNMPSEWFESSLKKSFFAGVHGARQVQIWTGRPSRVKVSYLHRWDRLTPSGSPMDAEVESSLDRFPFERVMAVEWQQPLWMLGQSRAEVGIKVMHSFPDQGSLVSSRVQLQSAESEFHLAFDVLGSESETVGGPGGFLSRYRSNDRFVAGYSYAF